VKIAVATSGKTLNSQVDPRFGRCPYFLIIESENGKPEVLENTAGQTSRGAGISAAQLIVNKGVGAVIAGNFGPNAINVLSSSGIKMFACPPKPAASGAGRRGGVSGITVKDALEQYKKGELKENTVMSPPAGINMGRGGGWGRGRQ
jgi:predicted Fe-Mo cluster-binding NifX family protein